MTNILLIDDDEMSAELIIDELKLIDEPFYDDKVFTIAQDKQQFYQYIDSQSFDIILSDYNIELGFTGMDVLNYIRDNNIENPVIVVSGAIGEEKAAELMKNGASDFVLKSNIDKLHQVIIKQLEQFTYKVNQNKIIRTTNEILMKFTKTINWILQHNLEEISFTKIISSFGIILEVDRSYIFEKHNNKYILKHLWCNVKRCNYDDNCDRNNHNCVSYENMNNIIKYINENKHIRGIYSDFDKETKKELYKNKIKSFILIPIIKPDNEIWGFMGFDDCEKERLWTQLEINTLKTLSAILGTLIFKLIIKKKEDNEIANQIKMLATARHSILSYLEKQE